MKLQKKMLKMTRACLKHETFPDAVLVTLSGSIPTWLPWCTSLPLFVFLFKIYNFELNFQMNISSFKSPSLDFF